VDLPGRKIWGRISLNPEIVVPRHGAPGTAKILDDMENHYTLLVERVGAMVKQGRSLDEIKDLRMPEADDWQGKDRFPITSKRPIGR
jgi:hypothetical protein